MIEVAEVLKSTDSEQENEVAEPRLRYGNVCGWVSDLVLVVRCSNVGGSSQMVHKLVHV
jgi:hypothetical protein